MPDPSSSEEGKPNSITFRFATYGDEIRFYAAIERSATTQTMILRTLAMTWVAHVETHGPVDFPVDLTSRRVVKEGPPPYKKK